MRRISLNRLAGAGFGLLLINSGYLAAFPQANLFYVGNVILHLGLGLALMAGAVIAVKRYPAVCGAILAAGVPALYLAVRGNTLAHRWVLWLHIALAVAAVAMVGRLVLRGRVARVFESGICGFGRIVAAAAAGGGGVREAVSESCVPHREPGFAAAVDGRGGGRREESRLRLLRRKPTRARSSLPISSWTRKRAGSATRIFTSSGRVRRITSLRSTISSTGNRSSTCRTWWGRGRANGARGATITRYSSMASSTGR